MTEAMTRLTKESGAKFFVVDERMVALLYCAVCANHHSEFVLYELTANDSIQWCVAQLAIAEHEHNRNGHHVDIVYRNGTVIESEDRLQPPYLSNTFSHIM